MNAATSIITTKSNYMARVSVTTPQINESFGKWVAESGVKRVYTIAADYGPGHDAEQAFHRGLKAAGGEIVGADRTPVANPDFSAYVQRVKDAKPEAVYIWVPGGAQPPAIGKALAERGMTPENTKILGQGELTYDEALKSMGDASIGIITAMHYDYNHYSALQRHLAQLRGEARRQRQPLGAVAFEALEAEVCAHRVDDEHAADVGVRGRRLEREEDRIASRQLLHGAPPAPMGASPGFSAREPGASRAISGSLPDPDFRPDRERT
jgi:ABC-type branched-subunit amino acid transport system substrate-binding protein